MRRGAGIGLLLLLAAAAPGGMAAASGAWLRPGPTIPSVRLVDQDGVSRDLGALAHGRRPVLVNFFFTGCQAICPTQTAQLGLLQDAVSAHAVPEAERPLILSVALDPLSDTPAAIRSYAARFGVRLGDAAGWLMLTGDEAELAPVWRAFDAVGGAPADHAALFWIARPRDGWTRTDITMESDALLDLLLGLTP